MNWNQFTQSSVAEILGWAKAQPWGQAMADCKQDAEYHSEGDVLTHVGMVCAELEKLDEWPTLSPRQQHILVATALLHDVAKPVTTETDPETGRVHTPKHSVKGEYIARSILRGMGCDLRLREEIAKMVRYHGRPVFFLEKENPDHEVVGLSWYLNNKLLYLFTLADNRGRDTEAGRSEDSLHLWRMLAEELNCFEQSYPFANDQARFLFFRDRNPSLFYTPHEEYRCTVTMLSGLPGSGKDTWLRHHLPELPVISLDDIRNDLDVDWTDNQGVVLQLAQKRIREFLAARQSFAFNATNVLRTHRNLWLNLFADYSARVEGIHVEPPLDVILAQNRARFHPVPERVILELAEKYEPVTLTEVHGLTFVAGK